MHRNAVGIGVLLFIFLVVPAPLLAGRTYYFSSFDFTLEILSPESFQSALERNPGLPCTEEETLDLARRVYPPAGTREDAGGEGGPDTDTDSGVTQPVEARVSAARGVAGSGPLWTALRNPELDDAARARVDQVLAGARPDLPSALISPKGYFKFFYTRVNEDPNQNVTPSALHRVATLMDGWWDLFVNQKFKEPKHRVLADSRKRIVVHVYDLGLVPAYRVNASLDFMELDSQAVMDPCARSSETAAAVFGRVMASYGYSEELSPTAWASYATLSTWGRKFASAWVGDYLDDMNVSLTAPGFNHLWIYLAEIHGNDGIREYLEFYESAGKNPLEALNQVFAHGLPERRYPAFVDQWNRANYCKDLLEIPGSLGYAENRSRVSSCGNVHGPLVRVPKERIQVESLAASYIRQSYLGSFTARYYEITWKPNMPRLRFTVTPRKNRGAVYCSILGVRGVTYERLLDYREVEPGDSYTYRTALPFWDGINKAVIVVSALEEDAEFDLLVGLQDDACLTGKWGPTPTPEAGRPQFNLVQRGMRVGGSLVEEATGCKYTVKGWYDPPETFFTLTNPDAPAGCEKETDPFSGDVADSCLVIIRHYYGDQYWHKW